VSKLNAKQRLVTMTNIVTSHKLEKIRNLSYFQILVDENHGRVVSLSVDLSKLIAPPPRPSLNELDRHLVWSFTAPGLLMNCS
jgi:hypothetical protein